MARSLKKGIFIDKNLLKSVMKARSEGNVGKKVVIKTKSRSSVVIPDMVGYFMAIHNGRAYVSVLIIPEMVGMKLGEFAPTRTFRQHSGDRKS